MSPRSLIHGSLFFSVVAFLAGCRQLAGYGGSVVFEEADHQAPGLDAGDAAGDETIEGDGSESADAYDDEVTADATVDESASSDVGEGGATEDGRETEDGRATEDGGIGDGAEEVAAEDAASSDASDAPTDATPDAPFCDPMAPGGTNVVTNPDFESGGTGWYPVNGALNFTVSSATSHCGTHSGESFNRNQVYEGLGCDLPSNAATYSVSMWVMQDGGSNLQFAIQGVGLCAEGGALSYLNISFPVVPPNTWFHVVGILTVPDGCSSMHLQVVQLGNPETDAGPQFPNLYIDDAYIMK